MNNGIKLTLIIVVALCTTYVFASTAIITLPGDKYPQADSCFIQTHWKQMGGFESYTPDKLRTGCWSTALAQIMYYHRLKPFGQVAYTSTHSYRINEHIDSAIIDLTLLTNSIDSTTSKTAIDALAKYNYYAALAVEKDFGTDNYMNKLAPAGLLQKHYTVKVKRYISWKRVLPYATGKLENIIRKEISHQRPLFLHFANLKNFGHSVVIDGYKQTDNTFMVHLNQGQGGPQDGWYNFDGDILKEGDGALRVIYTFEPYK